MSDNHEPHGWYGGWFLLVALILVGFWWWKLDPLSDKVARATENMPEGRCAEVTWLPLVHGCRGLVLLQLAGNRDTAETIVNAIRDGEVADARAAALKSVKLDYFFILSYVACLGFLAATLASWKRIRDVTWLRRALLFVVALQAVAGVLDGMENMGLFAMLQSNITSAVAERTYWASVVKWWLIAAGLAAPVLALLAVLVMLFLPQQNPSQTAGAGATGT
jgi:hypothetical protein